MQAFQVAAIGYLHMYSQFISETFIFITKTHKTYRVIDRFTFSENIIE